MSELQGIIEEIHEAVANELPAPTHEFGRHEDVRVAMRDGAKLMTRVFYPAGKGPWPAILVRNPYSPVNSTAHMRVPFPIFAKYGYVVVYQQARGTFDSEGELVPFESDREDGLDTLAWLAKQPWQDGNIGTFGGSYLSHVQWCMADRFPPEVKTMYFSIYGGDPYELFYENGMFKQGTWTSWALWMMDPEFDHDAPPAEKYERLMKAIAELPQSEMDRRLHGREYAWYRDWITNPSPGAPYWNTGFWGEFKDVAGRIDIPVMIQSGWFDIFLASAIKSYNRLPESTRRQSRFVIGPWHHGNATGGDLDYPNANPLGTMLLKDALAWFGHHLQGEPYPHPKGVVETYVIGEGTWRTWEGWIKPAGVRKYYLERSEGLPYKGGSLSGEPPKERQETTYAYDPNDPVPSKGGNLLYNYTDPDGPPECSVLQAAPGARSDVLTFVSAPLRSELLIAGSVGVRLTVSSDAADTSFTAKLIEVREDGGAYNIQDGIMALAYRGDAGQPADYRPGEPATIHLRLTATTWKIGRGSRIRLDVSSSNYPAYHAHPNVAGIWSLQDRRTVANQTLYTGGDVPSVIEIPYAESIGKP